ncbi:MAG: DUF4349 domain-containing protein [Solirubrobacteraceae bacterium]
MSPHDDLTDYALAVIDRTLAGDPVSAQDAELAELTLLLADERPRPADAFAAALDARVARRFARAPDSPGQPPEGEAAPRGSQGKRGRLRPRRWLYAPGLAGAIGVGVAVAIIAIPGSGNGSSSGTSSDAAVALKAPASIAASSSTSSSAATSRSSAASGAAAAGGESPQFAAPNRQVIQGAQLTLSTRPSRVNDVARQVFSVISAQNGVVESSNVTATSGSGGGAEFSLTVPNQNLGPAMAALSRLRGAQVISRNDVSRDVTGQAGGAGQQLADARALRTALLRKLALATAAASIDSLHLQIRDANASIASDLATLRGIQRQVANSHIELTINSVTPPARPHSPSSGGGFTLGRAVHDAKRVLVVAAGVGLIALAVLVPVGLLVALGLWLAHTLRDRRRERVLDTV